MTVRPVKKRMGCKTFGSVKTFQGRTVKLPTGVPPGDFIFQQGGFCGNPEISYSGALSRLPKWP